jgi:hypothetical protein
MRIVLERSGGFAGISQIKSISPDQMPADEAQKLTRLVENAGFYDLPSEIRSPHTDADRFQYKITVDSERGHHTVQVDEAAVPSRLQPLLDWLKNSARTRAGR